MHFSKHYIPIIGILLFSLLYIIATFYYPGGSNFDKYSVGFSWYNNFWCNLLDSYAINGKPNHAKYIASTAMVILIFSLGFFWWHFPKSAKMNQSFQNVIRISGVIAALVASLLVFNIKHDMIVNLSSLFGLFALIGTLIGLYKNKWMCLFYFGFFNFFLVGLNNLFYYDLRLINYLPVIQKITFLTFLLWICGICIKLEKQ